MFISRSSGFRMTQSYVYCSLPIRKNAECWSLAQDVRINILELQSHHIEIELQYLPTAARKLYHCRNIIRGDFLR